MTTATLDDSESDLASDSDSDSGSGSGSGSESAFSSSSSDLDDSSPQAALIGKHWNFPKMYLNIHVFEDIVQKGVTRNYNTKPNESMHRALKDNYHTRTNFKNVVDQVGVDHHNSGYTNVLL
jgi:hypothetical protein